MDSSLRHLYDWSCSNHQSPHWRSLSIHWCNKNLGIYEDFSNCNVLRMTQFYSGPAALSQRSFCLRLTSHVQQNCASEESEDRTLPKWDHLGFNVYLERAMFGSDKPLVCCQWLVGSLDAELHLLLKDCFYCPYTAHLR